MTENRERLEQLLKQNAEKVKAMSSAEREAMLKQQGASWARAEASWPKPKFKMADGVKVYESYEDYCND